MELIELVLDYVRHNQGRTITIGLIDEHEILKNWYKAMGFKETGAQKFVHLPFTVCFMEKDV